VAIGKKMKVLFADISERARQHHKDADAYRTKERRQVLALFDAIQIAIAAGQDDRVSVLLKELHAIVDAALTRRQRWPARISA
jgi:hypothetical protein